jgi:ribosomal protein S18 acetylase RimI-like enzyme
MKKSGLPVSVFFNTSGRIYKENKLKDRVKSASENELTDILASDGMVIKRPLIITEDFVLVGFNEKEWSKKLFAIKLLDHNYTNEAMRLMQQVVAAMKRAGIEQWDEIYSSVNEINGDIGSGCAFGFFDNGKLAAYFVLNSEYSPEYDSADWKTKGRSLIVHRLSVDPLQQGKGIAKKCMLFAEQYAKENDYNSIRLDAFSKNPAALRLYESLEYRKAGVVYFRKGQFYCYEKEIE